MHKVNEALVVFTLFVAQNLARSQIFGGLDESQVVGRPSSVSPTTEEDCRKDILILIDASNSIGRANFRNEIIPFLKGLVNDRQLNVDPQGTHISIMSFSTKHKTDLLLKFGERTTKTELIEFIETELIYGNLKGGKTRTGYALYKASEIFANPSPANLRKDVGDVVILITDGEPRGGQRGTETIRAINNAKLLKERDILIVGIAIAPLGATNEKKIKLKNIIRSITTKPEYTFDVGFNGLKSIVNKLVAASCTNPKAGDCMCNNVGSGNVYVKPGETEALVNWTKPILKCKKDLEITVQKIQVSTDKKSPSLFGVGSHKISYTYTIKSGDGSLDIEPCNIEFTVVSCDCKTARTKVVSLKPGNSEAIVDWTVPQPPEMCSANLKSVTPQNVSPGESFSFGKHTVKYVYKTNAGDVTCNVNIEVQGELCGGKAYNSKREVCCCGSSYKKKGEFQCCGQFYHNTHREKCCRTNANVVGIGRSCPGE